MFKTKIKLKKDKEKFSIETIDDVKQKIISHVKRDMKTANALLDELRQSYAETPYLLAEMLSDIAQEFSNTKTKLALLEEAFKLSPVHPMVLNRYAYALAKFKPKQVEKAFELFERAVKIDPHHVKTFYKYGLALEKYDQADKAFEMFERALQLEPDNYKALNSYAIALNRHGRAEKAFEMFERSLQVNSSDASTSNSYARALLTYGKTQKAFEMFERSLQVNANDTFALTIYGKALADKGAFEKAFEMFERSLQVDANDTITLTSYGKALAEKGAFQKAFEMFERSLQVDANDTIALNSYGKALADKGDSQKAFEMFERSLQVNANDTTTLNSYGKALAEKGAFQKAFDMFERSLQVNANDSTALNSYGKALAEKGEFQKAFDMFERSLQVDANDTIALTSYGKALAEKGAFEKAFEMFERSLQVNANNTTTLNSYGKALAEKGEFQKAFEMFERSLQVDANNTTTLNSYGKALAEKGAFEKAFDMFERSLQVDANDTIALNSYGYALAANNDFQKAFDQFEKSLRINSDDHITLFMYATVLEAAQKYGEAVSCIEKIRLAALLPYESHFLGIKLGQLCYLAKQEANGKKYFDEVIKNARDIDVGHLQAAKHILAIKPYSQEATDFLRKIIETSPNHTQALRMLSLDLKPKGYFEVFKTSAESALTDTEMLNRAIYHKILNEISMLKAISYQIVKDDRASEVLSKVIKSIESTYEKMTQLRNKEKTEVEQMPTDKYEEIVKIISDTAHNVADIANNELAIIKQRLQRVLKKLNPNEKDRLFYKLEKLLQRVESTETALNDLKSVNEGGIDLHNNTFKVKALFEPWQTTSILEHATLSFDIQNGDSEFVGDKEKIKSFLSELMENALKHNPEQSDLQIHISSEDIDSASHNTSKTLRKKILSANAKKSLLITFRDNGKGIPPERKKPIFLALETTSKAGSGLGLFIIKRTLEKMKGHIIETGRQGARFKIDIPYGEQ